MDTGQHDINDAGSSALEVIRSEEQLRVQVVRTAVETVRVTRRIVTETVQIPVTIRREEFSLTRTPATGSRPTQASADRIENLVLVLHEEVPVVSLQVRATERVTIGVDTVSTDQVVSADVRREQIEVDAPDLAPRRS